MPLTYRSDWIGMTFTLNGLPHINEGPLLLQEYSSFGPTILSSRFQFQRYQVYRPHPKHETSNRKPRCFERYDAETLLSPTTMTTAG